MTTDDLIASLTAEATPPRTGFLRRGLLLGTGAGASLTLLLFAAFWGTRADVWLAVRDPFFAAKTALPALLVLFGFPLVHALARPAGRSRASRWILAVPLLLAGAVIVALTTTPAATWARDWLGHSIAVCLVSIPVLSVPVLAGLLAGLRRGAPEHPARCGAGAGLLAGAVATLFYSSYCTEDSPLFYGTWYVLAIALVVAAGAALGSRLLRW